MRFCRKAETCLALALAAGSTCAVWLVTVPHVDGFPDRPSCYYVSPDGNDSNPGTSPATPWKTIAKVQSFQTQLRPGDSVLLQRGGVWYEQLDITNIKGRSEAPITIGNYGKGPLPVVDGGQTKTVRGRDYCIAAINVAFQWITVDGIECRNAYKQAITFQAFSQTGINGMGIVVQNSYIHHDGAGACTTCGPVPLPDPGGYVNQLDAQFTTGVKFLNNTLDHLGGHNAINVHYDTGAPIVSGNVVGTAAPHCNHNCIDLKGPVGALVINNVVTCPDCDSATAAFYTENTGRRGVSASDVTYVGNVILDAPIAFQAEAGGECLAKPCAIAVKVYNNTVILKNPSSYNMIDTSCTGHTWDVRKNIIDGGTTDIHPECRFRWDHE